MSKFMIIAVLFAFLATCHSLKKDKFKIKAKGFGLKNLQAPPPPPPLAAPAPYYPPAAPAYAPPPAAPIAPAPYYPPAAPAAGYGAAAATNAAASAGFTAANSVAPHVVPIIVPIALVSQPQASAPLMSQPFTSSQMASALGSQLAAQSYIPRVDLEYVSYPIAEQAAAPAYGYSAFRDSSAFIDTFNTADQFDTFGSDALSNGAVRSGYTG